MINIAIESHEKNIRIVLPLSGPAVLHLNDPSGWAGVQRFGKTAFTEYQGPSDPSLAVEIPLVINGKHRQDSQESNIKRLETLGTYMSSKNRTPLCQFECLGRVPYDKTAAPHIEWVIQNFDWGEYMLDEFHRFRVRQEVTVTFWQYSPDKIFAGKLHLPLKHVPKTYRIRRGDTLAKIAARIYGDQAKWHDIAKLNKIRDPNHLRVGRRIRLPRP